MNQKRKVPSLCSVPPCKGEHFDLTHKFPRDAERCILWLDAIGCPKLKQIPLKKLSQMSQVCSRHFRVEDYKHPQSRGLNMTAIPSLNLKDLSELHLSKAADSRETKNLHFVILPELIGMDPCEIETDKQIKPDIDDTDVRTEVFECVEMIPIEDLDDKHCADQSQLDPELADKSPIKPDRFSTFFEVNHPGYDNKLLLYSFWLRCHCRCFMCYDLSKCRRKLNPIDIPSDIQPRSVEQVDDVDVLTIEWEGGHKSQYDINFLFKSQVIREPLAIHQIPWHRDSDDIQEFLPIEFNQLVSFNENVELSFQNLSQHGVTVVENIPTQSNAMAKLVLCRLFPQLKATHFEELNEIHSDICTNLTYSSAECGLKCFFVTRKVEIILVDGLNVSHKLKASNADAFKTLSSVRVPLEISDDNVKWDITAPIIELNSETEDVLHLRLDVHRIGILNNIPQEQVEIFYDSLREMIRITRAEENQWLLRLKPGTLVILDNWRVFHKCFENAGISQCYLERKDYISRLRYLGLM